MGGSLVERADRGLRVEVLGPLRAWFDGRELSLGSNRRQAVLAVLTAHLDRPVSQRALIAGVWGGEVPASATGNLHTYLSGLRRALGPARDLLVSGVDGYSLRLAPEALDSAVFDRLHREAERKRAAGDPQAVVTLLDEALALWSGEAYAGVRSPFADRARRRLEAVRLEAVRARAGARLDLGEHSGLVPELTDLVRRYPLDQSLHELLMRALHRGGRHAEALEAFRAARTALAREGVEPGRALRELHQVVLAGPPARGPAEVGVLRIAPRPARLPAGGLLGRDAEVAALTGALDDVLAGRGRAVWVEGEAGIGKTALLAAALARTGDRPHHLAWAVADELSSRFPLTAVLDALDVTPASRDRRRAELATRLRDEAARHGWNRAAPVDRLLEHVAELCATAPLVLVLDDLHRLDDTSLLFWDRLVAATGHLPLLLVGATRPTAAQDRLARPRRSARAGNGLVLPLGPLPTTDVERLVGAVVGASGGPALRSLASAAAGNPRYALELTEVLVRDGRVRVVDGRAELDESAPGGALDRLPGGATALADLSEGARDVLRSAALLGARFDVTDLAAVTGRSPVHLLRVLDEAVAAGVVVESGDHLAFRHPFLRWAVYTAVPRSLRSALHREVAEALADAGTPVERVVEHLASATPDAWVADWLVAHREEVVERAPQAAVDLLRAVLATGLVEGADRTTLLMVLLRALFRLGHDLRAEAAEALAGAIGPEDAAAARHLLARARHRSGDVEGALVVLEDAVRVPGTPALWRTRHHALTAALRLGDPSPDDALVVDASAERAQAASIAAGDVCAAAYALRNRWFAASVRRDHARALSHVDEALALLGDDPDLAEARCDLLDNRAFTLHNLDRLPDAEATLREARSVIAERGLPTGMALPLAVHHYWTGEWERALVEMSGVNSDSPGTTFYGLRESGQGRVLLHGLSALIAIRRDEPDNARVHLDAAGSPSALRGSERDCGDFLLVATALAAHRRGAVGEAVDLLAPLLGEPTMVPRHQWLPLLVRLAREAGREDVARRAAAVCEEEAAREVVRARAAAAAAHCRALLTGDAEALAAVAAHHGSVGRVVEQLAALEDVAVVHARQGRCADAVADVEAGYRRLGARWDLRRVRQRLA